MTASHSCILIVDADPTLLAQLADNLARFSLTLSGAASPMQMREAGGRR